jgi:hypothetical protein
MKPPPITQEISDAFAAELRSLSLPTRAHNALYIGLLRGQWKARSIADLARLTEDDLRLSYNIGQTLAQQIYRALHRRRSHGPT